MAEQPVRTHPPAYKPVLEIPLRRPAEIKLSNGRVLYSLRSGDQPVVKIEILFDAGKWFEQKAAVSLLTSKMLSEGTASHSSAEISSFLESVGAHLEIAAGFDHLSVTVYCLEKHLGAVLPLLLEMVQEPVFPDIELETVRTIQIQSLQINLEKNGYVATRRLRESLFGSSHPYGVFLTDKQIQDITRQDLHQHFEKHIKNRSFTILISGSYSQDSLELAAESLGTIAMQTETSPQQTHIATVNGPKRTEIDREGSNQSSLRMGCASVPMTHGEYPALLIVNEILGGYFGSRLMKNIREDKGLTYGIHSNLNNLKHGGYFAIAADVKKDLCTQAFDEIYSELRNLREKAIDDDELDTVRNYMLGQIQASLDTPFSRMEQFKREFVHSLEADYLHRIITKIRSINAEEVQETANQHLNPDEMVTVSVG